MWKATTAAAVLCAALSTSAFAQDAKALLADVNVAMGTKGLTSITFSGTAAQGNFGQSKTISFRLASTSIRNYVRTIDFETPASLATGDSFPPQVPGGPPPQQGRYTQRTTADTPAWSQQMLIWVTPWGFLRGAEQYAATARSQKVDGVQYRTLTWVPPQKAPSGRAYKVVGYINEQSLVERVETWVEHPIVGDMHVQMTYTGYRDFGGLQVPTRISQQQVGMETFVVAIEVARANPSGLASLMTPPSGTAVAPAAPPAPPSVASEKLAEGIYRITGGYIALAVELKDGVAVLEGGQNEARGLAILAETKRLFPKKKIKYVVNTHPHFDHAGGLGPFIAEGITVLTDDQNTYFLEAAFGSPRTLVGDVLAKSRKKPKVEAVFEKLVVGDDARSIELHHVKDLEHSDGMILAYLPKEKILFTGDFNMPAAGQPASPSIANARSECRATRIGLRPLRHGAPAEPRSPADEGRYLRPGEAIVRPAAASIEGQRAGTTTTAPRRESRRGRGGSRSPPCRPRRSRA